MACVVLDTKHMSELSDRLEIVVARNRSLLEKIEALKIPKLATYTIRTSMENNIEKLALCVDYLRETAADYDNTENALINALNTGEYEIERNIPVNVPSNLPNKDFDDFIKSKSDAFDELYELTRDEKLDAATFIEWLSRNFLEDEEALKIIFGSDYDDESGLHDFIDGMYELMNGVTDFISTISDIGSLIGEDVEIEGLGYASAILAGLDLIFVQYNLMVGLIATYVGVKGDDPEMISAGTEYVDEALSAVSDFVLALAPELGPYALIIGLGVDYSINSFTNGIESILRKDSIVDANWNIHVNSLLETLNDNICGNFICQQVVKNKIEKPVKGIIDAVADGFEQYTGIDVRDSFDKSSVLDTLYNTDNWLKSLHKYFDSKID